jgi:hypothetical protein
MNPQPRPRRPRIAVPCGLFGHHITSPKVRAQHLVASTNDKVIQLLVELHQISHK